MIGSAQILKGLLSAASYLKPATILFLCMQMFNCTAQQKKSPGTAMQTYRVARVIEPAEANYTEVTFLESPRIFRILKNNKHYSTSIALLKDAEKNNKAVLVSLAEPNGDVIEKVESVSLPKEE